MPGRRLRDAHVALPLRALAGAFGRLADGDLGPHADRVAAAMGSNPELVGYAGTIDTELMAGEDGLVAKIGAEGLLGIGRLEVAR